MVVTPDIVSKVLHVPRIAHPDYPGCERLGIVSEDEFASLFCESPSPWGDRQNTSCSNFAKGLKFLNIVISFILHPLSHYNSITKPRVWFLLSLLEDISIGFSSHIILSLIDVYKDTTTRDKLIFPLAIMRILRHFCLLSWVSSLHDYECHRCYYRSMERGTAQTEAALNRDGNSSSFYRSIHLLSFFFCRWSDSWDHHGTACTHGCSPWHT